MNTNFVKGFIKEASKGKAMASSIFSMNVNKKNENPLKIPKEQTAVRAAKPGIQHTSGMR